MPLSILLVCLSSVAFKLSAASVTTGMQPLDILRTQLVDALLPEPGVPWDEAQLGAIDSECPVILNGLNSSGLWPDIDYYDSSARSDWPAATHLRRCLLFGTAYNANSSTFYKNASYADAANRCTASWLLLSPVNSNWWWMQFGTLQCIAKLLLLVPNATLLAHANTGAFPRLTLADVSGFDGANRLWAALIHVMIGALNGNASHVDAAYSLIGAAYAPVPGGVVSDGLQLDAGFHQHGPLAQASPLSVGGRRL